MSLLSIYIKVAVLHLDLSMSMWQFFVHHVCNSLRKQVVGRYTLLIVQFKSYMLVHSIALRILVFQLKGPLHWPVHCVSTTALNNWSELLDFSNSLLYVML